MASSYEEEIEKFCERLKNRCIKKFREGAIEHADQEITELDCIVEIAEEIRDLINYASIHRVNKT